MAVVNRRVPGQGAVILFAGYDVVIGTGPEDEGTVVMTAGQREDAEELCAAFE